MLTINQIYHENINKILEKSSDYIFLYNDEGNLIDVNSGLFKDLGYSREEILLLNIKDLIFEEDYSNVIKMKQNETLPVEVPKSKIYKARKKDGTFLYFEGNPIPITNDEGVSAVLTIGHNITRFIQVEQDLRDSEAKFRILFNNAIDGILLADSQTLKFFTGNKKICQMLGFTIEELKNLSVMDIHPKEDISYVLNQFNNQVNGNISLAKDIPVKKKDGKIFYCDINSSTVKILDKLYLMGIFRDITDRKKTEEKLKLEKEKLQAIIDGLSSAEIGIDIVDINYNIHFQNRFLNERFNNISGKYCYERYMAFNKPCKFCPMIRAIKHHKQEREVLLGADERYYELISAPIANPDGTIDKAIEVVLDITERKNSEQKIRESEEKFRTIAEQSFMGIIIVQDGKVKYSNKTIETIVGYSIEEILSWSAMDIIKLIHPKDIDHIKNRLERNIGGEMELISNNSYRIINKQGDVRWLEDYSTKIIYEGKVANLLSIVDITDKKKAEELIFEEYNKLVELEQMRKDLITRISHELKTPLTIMYGATQLVLLEYENSLDPNILNFIETCYRGCIRLKELIENLLDASRLESNNFELFYSRENLTEVIQESIENMRYLAKNRKLIIQQELNNEIFFEIDKIRLRQVFNNIISNAIKNTSPEGEINIKIIDTAEYIDIHIKDTGIGITQEERDKLFQRFGKIERYGEDLDVDIDGPGLGLYISKKIVELHNGQVIVESEGRNKGSNFIIRLFKEIE